MKNYLFSLIIITAIFLTSGYKYEPNKGTIVSLAPFITEILYEIGADDKLVAVTSWSDYPPQVIEKEQLGSAFQINKEAILRLKPEYVLCVERHRPMVEDLTLLGIKVIYFPQKHLSDVYKNMKTIGEIAEKAKEAEELAKKVKKEIEKYKAKKKKRILYVINPDPLMVVGKDAYISELLEKAGHENVMNSLENNFYGPFPIISYEFAMAQNPDLILIAHFPEAESYIKGYLPLADFKYLDYEQGSILVRAGPRIIEGIKILSEL